MWVNIVPLLLVKPLKQSIGSVAKCYPLHLEALAVIEGVKLTRQRNIQKAIIERDPKVIIDIEDSGTILC